MPGIGSDQALLDEILEVRGEPLNEIELWSVLLESGNVLKNVLGKASQDRLLHLALTLRPDTILLCLNGCIKLAITKTATANKKFIAPESFSEKGKCSLQKIEKMLVYCLGMSILAASENGLDVDKELLLSQPLERLLFSMIDDSPSKRLSVVEVIHEASRHIDTKKCHSIIRSLAIEIVGPYGLQPLSIIRNLPDIPTSVDNNYPFDPGPTTSSKPLEPLQSLPAVPDLKPGRNSVDLTDSRPYSPDSENESEYSLRKFSSPPVMKSSLTPRSMNDVGRLREKRNGEQQKSLFSNTKADKSKPWSPSFSSPDFEELMELENEKIRDSGYARILPRLGSPNRSLSMPSLNEVDDQAMHVDELFHKSKGKKSRSHHQSIGVLTDRTSLTSQFSSQMSLTHGAYVLNSDPFSWSQEFPMTMVRSGSSNSQNSLNSQQPTNFHQLPLRPSDNLNLVNLGPEFVRIADNPDKAVVDMAPPRLGPLPKGTRKITVVLQNNQQIQTNVQVNSKAKDVFDQIVDYLKLKETLYFGLTQVKDGEEMFLDLDTKLTKYAPIGWKEENPKKRKQEFLLYFRVKFFLRHPSALKHCLTVHLYYLQLRQFILSGYIQCPDDLLMNLTGYALQAEYGPYLPDYNGVEYFKKEFYIPGKVLSRVNRVELLRNLPQLHVSRSDLSREEAELAFVEEASRLPEYGVVFHKVSRSKKNEDDFIWLGIGIEGVIVVEPRGKQRAKVHEQSWDLIKEFTFEKKKFVLKPKCPDVNPKLVFYTNHYRKSKYLFRMCQSFHRFQIFHQTHVNQLSKKLEQQQHGKNKKNKRKSIADTEKHLVTVVIDRNPGESLGLTIVGGENSRRLKHGIFISTIKPDGVCAKDGRFQEGDQIISVNAENLEKSTHEEAAVILKSSQNPLKFVLLKQQINMSVLDKSGLSPNTSQVVKYKESFLQHNDKAEEVKRKLLNISLVDDESEGTYSERAIDVDGESVDVGHRDSDSLSEPERRKEAACDDSESKQANADASINQISTKAIVNSVEIDRDSDEQQLSESSETIESFSGGGLKRFAGFHGALDKAGIESDYTFENDSTGKLENITSRDKTRSKTGKAKNDSNLDDAASLKNMTKKNTKESMDVKSTLLKGVHEPIAANERAIDVPDSLFNATLDSMMNRTLNETIEEILIDIEKVDGSFGFSIQGGKDSSLPLGCVYVKAIHPKCSFALSKKLREGDRILAVNGESLEDVSHAEAVNILKTAPQKSSIVIDRGIEVFDTTFDRPQTSTQFEDLKKDSTVFEVELEKRNDGLGLSLAGGRDSDICYKGCIMIKKIFPGYAMSDSGKFLVGDILLVVNDQLLEGMTYQQAVSVIRNAPKNVRIIARRPNTLDIPQELFETTRPVSPQKLMKESKYLSVSGRGSREGHRIAKELLESLTGQETDEDDSVDIPLSSRIASSYADTERDRMVNSAACHYDDDDTNPISDDFDSDPQPPLTYDEEVPSEKRHKYDPIKLNNENEENPLRNHLNEVFPKENTSGDQKEQGIRSNKSNQDKVISADATTTTLKSQTLARQSSSSSTDSTIGFLRHRPPKKQVNVSESNKKEYSFKQNKENTIVAVELKPQHDTKPEVENQDKNAVQETMFTVAEQYDVMTLNSGNNKVAEQHSKTDSMNLPNLPKESRGAGKNLKDQQPTQRQQQPYNSPKALKSLNALSRNSSPANFERRRKLSASSRSSSVGEIISIQLEKSDKGLGITLGTTSEIEEDVGDYFVYIKKLVPGSVAERNGMLHAGDRILTVNGKNVEGFSKKEVVSIFRGLSGTISMEFFRPPEDVLLSREKNAESKENSLKLPKLPADNSVLCKDILSDNFSPTGHQRKLDITENNKTGIELTTIQSSRPTQSTSDSFLELRDNNIDQETKFESSQVISEEITFNSHDGLSFADSFSGSDDEDCGSEVTKQKEDVMLNTNREKDDTRKLSNKIGILTEPIQNNETKTGLSDNSNDSSEISNMNENGVIDMKAGHSQNQNQLENLHTEPNFTIVPTIVKDSASPSPTVSSRPPSGNSAIRTSGPSHSNSGIPRLIRSRSNSLASEASGGSGMTSRRGSNDSTAIMGTESTNVAVIEGIDDDSQEHFIDRLSFVYFTERNVREMLQNIEKHKESSYLNTEYNALRQIKTTESSDAASRACNRGKNRVKTILPFDSNRVHLMGGEESDYINASHIKIKIPGGKNTSQYIVSQAPLESTVEDFWRCVWEKKIEVVVMLTREEENGKLKCHKYWPSLKKTPVKMLDKFTVELLYEEYNGSYIYRQIQLRNIMMDKSLFVTQGCFTQWPETGVPQDPIEFLGFMKFIRNFSASAPTLVHCSAGVGRSGVYVVVDSIWDTIEQDQSVDVQKMSKEAKGQRHLLIQTKEQYSFIYEATRELFADLLSVLSQQ